MPSAEPLRHETCAAPSELVMIYRMPINSPYVSCSSLCRYWSMRRPRYCSQYLGPDPRDKGPPLESCSLVLAPIRGATERLSGRLFKEMHNTVVFSPGKLDASALFPMTVCELTMSEYAYPSPASSSSPSEIMPSPSNTQARSGNRRR
jgi:hypothetical protein